MPDWRMEILDEEREARASPRADVRQYGPVVLAFVLGWLIASVTQAHLPLP